MFLDSLPGFNYNLGQGEYIFDDQGQRRANNTRQLGSTLMKTMLNEVKDFCDPDIKDNWSHKPHQQVYTYMYAGSDHAIGCCRDMLVDSSTHKLLAVGVSKESDYKALWSYISVCFLPYLQRDC